MTTARTTLSTLAFVLQAISALAFSACTKVSPEPPPIQTHLEVHPTDLSSNVGEGIVISMAFESPRTLPDHESVVALLNRSITLLDDQDRIVEVAPVTELTSTSNGELAATIQPATPLSSGWHTLTSDEELTNHFRFNVIPEGPSSPLKVRIHPKSAPVLVMALVEGGDQKMLSLKFSEPVGPAAGHSMETLIRVTDPGGGLVECVVPQNGDDTNSVFRRIWSLECESSPSGMGVYGATEIVSAEGVPASLLGADEPGFEIELYSDAIGTPLWLQD